MEWVITKSLDNSTEIDELISEKRREGIMKDSTTSTTIISEFRSPEDVRIKFFLIVFLTFNYFLFDEHCSLICPAIIYAFVGILFLLPNSSNLFANFFSISSEKIFDLNGMGFADFTMFR